MNRRSKILEHCKKRGTGLEIGPSFNPIAPKSEGYDVDVLDHATADELKAKYAPHGVDITKIEPVDFVWKGQPIDDWWDVWEYMIGLLFPMLSNMCRISSLSLGHVVISLSLTGFSLSLSLINDIVLTFSDGQRLPEMSCKHGPRRITGIGWELCSIIFHLPAKKENSMHGARCTMENSVSFMIFSDAASFFRDYGNHNEYVDAHAWRFTPSSFRLILMDLKKPLPYRFFRSRFS